ncbi:Annexin protein [Phytophthora megakarya]|uniref:Annexin n=2 Tax=Phytophthora megakarya TaxID=4795 RepID=A0A225VFA2_9STRA|nr:Annexin protein [Phytophthora megakarya]
MTLELYPASAHDAFHGSGIQYPQHIDEAVRQIYGACKGLGTDEQTLITVLGSKSPETRNLIALRYKELYNEPLKSLLKSETSGDFGRLLRMISTPLPETEAQILRDATKGMGTTESLIIQILSGRTNDEMSMLKRSYFDLVGKDLAVTLNAELSGDFRKVVMAVLQSSQEPYNPAVHNAAKAEEDAVALYKAGQGRLGTNEEVFIGLLVKAPPEFLKMMDAVYVAKYNNNIAKAVDKEFSGDAKKSLNYLVRSTLDPYPAIAEVFEKTMKGFGTDETGLSTTLVRYQSLLPYVKAVYKKQYHEELRDRISGETSGDYKKLLLEVFDAPQDPPKGKTKGFGGVASSGGYSAAPVGASSPAYLATQSSYASSTSSLHSTTQGHGASSAYPPPTGQQSYRQSPGAAPSQGEYGAIPHQTSTSQAPAYTSQTSMPQYGNPPEQYASSGHQPASQQSHQYPSPSTQAHPQHGAPPPNQQYQQNPPGGQSQPYQHGMPQQAPNPQYHPNIKIPCSRSTSNKPRTPNIKRIQSQIKLLPDTLAIHRHMELRRLPSRNTRNKPRTPNIKRIQYQTKLLPDTLATPLRTGLHRLPSRSTRNKPRTPNIKRIQYRIKPRARNTLAIHRRTGLHRLTSIPSSSHLQGRINLTSNKLLAPSIHRPSKPVILLSRTEFRSRSTVRINLTSTSSKPRARNILVIHHRMELHLRISRSTRIRDILVFKCK